MLLDILVKEDLLLDEKHDKLTVCCPSLFFRFRTGHSQSTTAWSVGHVLGHFAGSLPCGSTARGRPTAPGVPRTRHVLALTCK